MRTFDKISFLVLFLSLSFGCQTRSEKTMDSQAIFPAERFSVFQGTLPNGRPVVGNVNLGYRDYDKKADYPWCLTLNIALDRKNLFENGLPKNEESTITNRFEDDLLAEIKKRAVVHYIGHAYGDEFLDVFVYLDDPEKVNEYLKMQVENPETIRGFRYEIKKDKEWETIKPYLDRR